MTKGNAIVPRKPLELPAAMVRTEDLLRLWMVDLETAPPEEVRPLCQAVLAALQAGQPPVLAAAILAPISKPQLALELDELIAAFPGMRKDADMATFSRVLAEEVMADKPSHAAVHGACRALIRSRTFPPAIGEVVEAVAAQKAAWASRAALLERLPRRLEEAVASLGGARGGQ